jgi:hypothetical protein
MSGITTACITGIRSGIRAGIISTGIGGGSGISTKRYHAPNAVVTPSVCSHIVRNVSDSVPVRARSTA